MGASTIWAVFDPTTPTLCTLHDEKLYTSVKSKLLVASKAGDWQVKFKTNALITNITVKCYKFSRFQSVSHSRRLNGLELRTRKSKSRDLSCTQHVGYSPLHRGSSVLHSSLLKQLTFLVWESSYPLLHCIVRVRSGVITSALVTWPFNMSGFSQFTPKRRGLLETYKYTLYLRKKGDWGIGARKRLSRWKQCCLHSLHFNLVSNLTRKQLSCHY